jgi:hypothetical protein
MKTILITLLTFLTVFSCDDTIDSNIFRYDAETDFKPHILYTSDDNQLKVEIKKISDSRCPTGVTCIWQGEAKVSVQTNSLSGSSTGNFVLSTYNNLSDTIESTWSVKLLDVSPYPVYQQPTDSNKYVVRLVIKRIKS